MTLLTGDQLSSAVQVRVYPGLLKPKKIIKCPGIARPHHPTHKHIAYYHINTQKPYDNLQCETMLYILSNVVTGGKDCANIEVTTNFYYTYYCSI